MNAKSNMRWPAGFLVVGVDGSAGAVHALRWAADLATRSGQALVVIHAWSYLPPAAAASLGWTARDRPRQLAAARRELTSCLSAAFGSAVAGEGGWTVDGLSVRAELRQGSPGPVLCAAATGADQLIVGVRGRSATAGLLLGSVSQHVAAHAPCPVTVVRDLEDELRRARDRINTEQAPTPH
jgi:nucleotide-binding universal stress UspA family protein